MNPRAKASQIQLPEAKNCWNSGNFALKTSKLTSTSRRALETSTAIATAAGTENSQPNAGSIRWRIRSGSIPRKRIDMMLASHAIHCRQIR